LGSEGDPTAAYAESVPHLPAREFKKGAEALPNTSLQVWFSIQIHTTCW
jgi:hypothetical protein